MKKKRIRFLAFILAGILCLQAPVSIRAETLDEAITGEAAEVSEETQASDTLENISTDDNVSDNVDVTAEEANVSDVSDNVDEALSDESNTSTESEGDTSSDNTETETPSIESQGEIETETTKTLSDVDEYGNISGASNEDATYEGYVENEDGSWTVTYSDGTTNTVDKDIVRQSNWYKEKYENGDDDELEFAELTYYHVTFTDSITAETVSEQDVLEKDAATEPEIPEHENYEFSGYSADFSDVTEDMNILIEYEASEASFDYENDEIVESELADKYGEENPEWYKDFEYKLYNGPSGNRGTTINLYYYKGDKKDVFIPSTATINGITYNTYFSYRDDYGRFFKDYGDYVESVILSSDMEWPKLPTTMFAGLTIPTRVYLPSFKINGNSVFKECTNITDVTIGTKPGRFYWEDNGYYTFESCTSLQNVNISSDTYFYIAGDDFKNAGSEGLTLTLTGDFRLQRSDSAFVGANYDKLSFNGVLGIGGKTGDTFKGTNIKIIDFTNTIIDANFDADDKSVDGFFANSNIEEVYFGNNSRLINSFEEYTYEDENYGPYYTNLFKNCKKLRIVDWPNADSTGIISINSMFYNCASLTTLNLGPNFTCSDVSRGLEDGDSESGTHQYDGGMTDVFKNCSSLKSLDLSNWNNRNSKACNSMFAGCTSLESIKFGENFTCESCETIVNMFKGCSSLKYIDMSSFKLNSMLEGWNTTIIKGCDALIAIDTPIVTNDVATKLDYDFYEISSDHAEYDTWKTLPSDMDNSHRIYRYMNTINIESYFENEDGTIDTLDDMFITRYFYRPIDLAYFNLDGDNLDANDWYVYADDNNYSINASMIDLDDNTYAFSDTSIDSANPGTYKFVYSVKKAVVPDDKTEDDKTDDTNSDTSKNDAASNSSSNNTASNSSAASNTSASSSSTTSGDVTITYAEPEGAEELDNAITINTAPNPGTDDISLEFIIALVLLLGAGICLTVYGTRNIKKETK